MGGIVVVALVAPEAPTIDTPFSRWVQLPALSASPLYLPVAIAMAHTAAYLRGRTRFIADATRGARELRPLSTAAYVPPLRPAAWPTMLQFAESVDATLRAKLSARPADTRVNRYLREWVP